MLLFPQWGSPRFATQLLLLFLLVSSIKGIANEDVTTPNEQPAYKYQVKYIDVPLDHFTYHTNATFKLRYLINDSYWVKDEEPPGPIFFYTGNEGDITMFAENTGFMWELAPQLNALIVFAEHRYYGTSLPFGNSSYEDPAHLGYLSSSQAIGDFVFLIGNLRETLSAEKSSVIAFGGSYGGMLASWIRIKYPFIVQGAIASSAPILMFPGLKPCNAYNRVLTSAFSNSSPLCSKAIRNSWSAFETKSKSTEGLDWISKQWKLCKPLKSANDVTRLKVWFSDVLSNIAMTNYPYPSSFLNPVPAYPVRVMCEYLNKELPNEDQLLQSIYEALNVYTNYTGNLKCLNIDASATEDLGEKGWSFQACTEMVMPICSDGVNDFFEPAKWDFTSYSDECFRQWKVRPDPYGALNNYGGENLQSASNIVFSNGLLDPWSSLGVLGNVTSNTIVTILIPEGAHHLDLRAANPEDPYSVVSTRIVHRREIKKWMLQYYKLMRMKGY